MRHTIVAWMEDKPGVLMRVASLFRRRNYNIESLTVGHSETEGISRMTFVVEGDDREIHQVQTQLFKLINVTAVKDVTKRPTVIRELALIKVSATGAQRAEIIQLVSIYRASIVDVEEASLIIQIAGPQDRVNSLIKLLSTFGIQEIVRTGSVAMVRGEDTAPAQHSGVS
jgi:acetolactate synthase I/III small subunit